jgi:hypothetical protein
MAQEVGRLPALQAQSPESKLQYCKKKKKKKKVKHFSVI